MDVLVFGVGFWGKSYFDSNPPFVSIKAFVDNNPPQDNAAYKGVPIIKPSEICGHEYDKIVS